MVLDGAKLTAELESKVREIFSAYAQGLDVSPAERFHAEGFAEAMISAGCLSADEWVDMIARLYREATGRELPDTYRGLPCIPLLMRRAPVY